MKKIFLITILLLISTNLVFAATITITVPDDKVDEVASAMCPENPTSACVKKSLEDAIKQRVKWTREKAAKIEINVDDVIGE